MPMTWAWDFDNDGTVDSHEQDPTFTYNIAGSYTVKLTVTNAAGSDKEVKADYIRVSAPPVCDCQTPKWKCGQLTISDITETSLQLTWEPATDNVGVTAYKVLVDGSLWDTVDGATLTYQVEGLSPNTNYCLKIEAGDAAGNWTTNGPGKNAKTLKAKPPVCDCQTPKWNNNKLTISGITDTSLQLTWKPAIDNVGVTAYKVLVNRSRWDTVDGATLTYRVEGLSPNTKYSVKIEAGDAAGNWTTNGLGKNAKTVKAKPDNKAPQKAGAQLRLFKVSGRKV